MAAFSSSSSSFQHHHPFNLLDSVFLLPNTPSTINKMCGLLEEPNNANSTTQQFNYQPQETFHQNIGHSTKVPAPSNNSVLSLTNMNSTMDSSSIVTDHKFNSTTQKVITTPMEKKRKFKEVSSVNSAQSKEVRRGVKGKKDKKIIDGDGEKNKSKEEKKIEKKATEGYIHVRARRGQATDSHSLAERVRRERISEKMKLLQALVPGCDKVTGKALMLDEIINYVQSLQNQVEFLSMKLVSVNPMLYDFGMDLESFMVRPHQNLNSLPSPLPTMRPSSSPTSAAPNDYSNNFLDTTTTTTNSLLFQHYSSSQDLPNVNRQILWEVDEQRQKIINQTGFSCNSFFPFH
ncbi:hypothetical protein ACJIZ3_010109 [Penstemon smallii]|uniref:BHLH domain-containing protein n=1 Tax=Penstemon smallii TaxID=265156 RepID=A0ABD3TFS5_9LAMI